MELNPWVNDPALQLGDFTSQVSEGQGTQPQADQGPLLLGFGWRLYLSEA